MHLVIVWRTYKYVFIVALVINGHKLPVIIISVSILSVWFTRTELRTNLLPNIVAVSAVHVFECERACFIRIISSMCSLDLLSNLNSVWYCNQVYCKLQR